MNVKEFTDKVKEAFPTAQVQGNLFYDTQEGQTLKISVIFPYQASFVLTDDNEFNMEQSGTIIGQVHDELKKLLPETTERKKK